MKKFNLALSFLCLLIDTAQSQINWGTYSQSFDSQTIVKPSNFGLITTIPEINNAFWSIHSNDQLTARLANDPTFSHGRPKEFIAINSFDTAMAHFFLHGVNKSNAHQYEYRVTDSRLTEPAQWKPIIEFSNADVMAKSMMPQMAYLGGYKTTLGNKIIVDVRKRSKSQIIATSVVAWTSIKPVIIDIFTPNEFNIFFKRLSEPDSYVTYSSDKRIAVPKHLVVEPTDNNLVFYLQGKIYDRKQLEYQLIKGTRVVSDWRANEFDNNFIWLKDLNPGSYTLSIRYSAQREYTTTYSFAIKTPWYQSVMFEIVIAILSAAFIGLIISVLMQIRGKRLAELELAKKTKMQLELKAIYAQLNPHFIFNALSSIQGLVNKNDIIGANQYLSDFARLLRQSLNNSTRDAAPLQQEIAILETYLKLEQLRFSFKYEIDVSHDINTSETEIPSLLLQPLVENAVKHGVAFLQENGLVNIDIAKQDNDMVITIKDNGKGFTNQTNDTGFGLKLTRDRIKLTNQLSKGQSIVLEISDNAPSGALLTLVFKNWFL